MNYYNKKCLGCGQYLNSDQTKQGYTPKLDHNTKYCMRCFKLIHYKTKYDDVNELAIKTILQKIDVKNNFIIIVIDLFNIKNSLLEQYKNNKNVLYIVNKFACFPKHFNLAKTISNIKQCFIELQYQFIDIILYDCYTKKNLHQIWNYIEQASKNKQKTYIIGRTNVGKSCFINALLKMKNNNLQLAVSPFKNTTLDLLQIKIDKSFIIDTPGFENDNSITSYLDCNALHEIFNSKFDLKCYNISSNDQAFILEGLIGIKILEIDTNVQASLTIYKYQKLKFLRCKHENVVKNLGSKKLFNFFYNQQMTWKTNVYQLADFEKYTFFLSGLGFIVLKNVKKIACYHPKKIVCFLTKNSII